MNKRMFEKIMQFEGLVPMEVHEPANGYEIANLKDVWKDIPQAMLELFEISNGLEINVPGTVIYSIHELLERIGEEQQRLKEGLIPFGVMSFGDYLYMKPGGKIIQVDHEERENFLEWNSIEDFLDDEFAGCES
ncbi:MAG: SMI1/KNR4 family protein [Bacteroidales bacterium]|nr:SMI1/KNR4 family protein [Bacteroidales bacterium]